MIRFFIIHPCDPTVGYVDALYADFVDIHSNEMKRKLSPIKPKSNKNTYKKRQPFWTENLDRLYKEAARAEKAYQKFLITQTMKSEKNIEFSKINSQSLTKLLGKVK